jgi:protein-ribulosamine 3-kinase
MLTRELASYITQIVVPVGDNTEKVNFQPIGGGSINQAFKINLEKGSYFCKVNSATKFPQLFEKECQGLHQISNQGGVKVPQILHCFEFLEYQVLILEWITTGKRDNDFWERFGKQMAAMHHISNEYFGFRDDNYMGSVTQSNEPSFNWCDFFYKSRLQPMISKCFNANLLTQKHVLHFERLFMKLPQIFSEGQMPALVHGDLWNGNFMCNEDSEPVLIDPAISYAHPSVDLGMSTLFGGFNQRFYESYQYYNPLPLNYKEQWEVSNLYPLLIHLFLFGSSYLHQIEQTLYKY